MTILPMGRDDDLHQADVVVDLKKPRESSKMSLDERLAAKRAEADAQWAGIAETVLKQFAEDAGGAGAVELWAPQPHDGVGAAAESMHLVARHVVEKGCMEAESKASIGQTAASFPTPTAPGVGYAAVLAEGDRGAGALGWITMDELASNPEREEDTRAKALAGLYAMAAAIRLPGGNGAVVLLLPPKDEEDPDKPDPPCTRNSAAPFLRGAADVLAKLMVLRAKRGQFLRSRAGKAEKAWRVLKAVLKLGVSFKPAVDTQQEESRGELRRKFINFAGKFKGSGGKAARLGVLSAAFLTFLGVFLMLLPLSSGNQLISEETSGEYGLLLGSMGALATLLYSAPASPLAQPRNIYYGHMLSAMIGIVLNYATESAKGEGDGMPRWLTQALSPALAISSMQYLGITHPPAGAISLIMVSSGKMIKLEWGALGAPILVMITFAVLMASIWNNAQKGKQYPTGWNLNPKLFLA